MSLRFRKSIKIAPGVKMNISKKGIGYSVGTKGARVSVGANGRVTRTIGIPGTGVYDTATIGNLNSSNSSHSSENSSTTSNASGNSYINSSGAKPPKKNGCLSLLLKFLAFCVALALLPFVWIVCLIYLIFLRKRLNIEPKKKKLYNILAIIFLIISLFAMILSFDTSIKTLEISVNNTEMDINSEQDINISFTPENADISGIVFESSDDTIASVVNKNDKFYITTNSKEGNVQISVQNEDGSVKSNTLELSVIDKERVEAEKKAQEEAAAKAEAEKKAQEEAAAKAEAEKKAQEEAAAAETAAKEQTVWISSTGSKYHSNPNCSNMQSAQEVTLSDAIAMGYEPCARCY